MIALLLLVGIAFSTTGCVIVPGHGGCGWHWHCR
jgi:hypothetical protein